MTRTLWDSDRLTLEDAMRLTAESLRTYGATYRHWACAFSGGKDSSATATALCHLLLTGAVPPPASLTFLYADTRMEFPPLQLSAMELLTRCRDLGHRTQVVLPELDRRFMVYVLGRGVPPPTNRFRWCTGALKVEPMLAALAALREQTGEKLLMVTGVRVGESAARDQRIALSCGRDGAECGQGWFQEATPDSIADTLAPLLHWRTCHVWDWLSIYAPQDGFATRLLAKVYDQDEEGSDHEKLMRTGCIGCNLASRDYLLQRITEEPCWSYLEPLARLRPLYEYLRKQHNRLRKCGELNADGTPGANQGRMGPLTMRARLYGLAQVLDIQERIEYADARGRQPSCNLIDLEEHTRIRELIELNTWPDRWDGTEPVADSLPFEMRRDGSIQHLLWEGLQE